MHLDSTLKDTYNRRLNYLRVSVTDRCNLRCLYCVPPSERLKHKEVLRYEEILRIIRIGVYLGISKVRITGGEPLVRKGICTFLKDLNEIDGLEDISLTTNGVFLKDKLKCIRAAGIKRLNISLDTLKRDKYQAVTGSDRFNNVWEGIQAAHDMGFDPIKINVVALKGINDDELADLAGLSLKYPFHIRFIEFMPIGISGLTRNQCMTGDDIMSRIGQLGTLVPVDNGSFDGPAQRYKIEGAPGEIGLILSLTNHFCSQCNRLRLTANGQLRPCLLSDVQIDMKKILRKGCLDPELANVYLEAARRKPSEHRLRVQDDDMVISQMSSIGG